MSDKRLKRIYVNMKTRCCNPNYDSYHNYGGRGIGICDEWLGEDGFVNFKEWSLINGYDDNLTIDRINNDGNYSPINCRWITRREQSYNRRTNVIVNIEGIEKTISEWAEISGIDRRTLKWRIDNGKREDEILEEVKPAEKLSGIKGITWHKKGYWQVSYKYNNLKKSKSFKALSEAKDFLEKVVLNG